MLKPVFFKWLRGAALISLLCFATIASQHKQEAPSPPYTPAEELTSFQLEPGLKIELVASEPMVQDPVVTTFDPDGRMWVVEMRGFMTDINGTEEKEPMGRISVLEDRNNDGVMDTSTIYMDSLVMPRAIALITKGALVAERGSLWLTQDLDNDLRADTKTLIDSSYAGSPLPEHSGNGLWRGIDNWYYNAKSRFRYRLADGMWQRDSTEFRGQWGICHDDEGRLIYNYNWSQLHADLVPPNYLSRNRNHQPTTGIDHGLTVDRRIYPIRPNPAVNRGYIPGTLDKEGRLLEFTAACSPLSYRGTALPLQYHSNVFVCEPSGNLVKRNIVEENGLLLTARDPNPGREFLASTDERFRPVQLSTGPDGALYVTDMYRGLVQHAAYITPYLREQSIRRRLVQPVHYGRIWRIVPDNWKQPKRKRLSTASSSDLVGYLSHANGWYRDIAQRLLIERNDRNIGPALIKEITKGKKDVGRLHAMWTLQELKLVQPELLLKLVNDQGPIIAATAIRLLEPFASNNPNVRLNLQKLLLQRWQDAPDKKILQIALSAGVLDPGIKTQILAGISERTIDLPLMRDAVLSSLEDQEFTFLQYLWKAPLWQRSQPGKEIFLEMLATAIMHKKNASELSKLLAMLDGREAGEWRRKAVITGLSMGGLDKAKPVRLASAPAIFTKTRGKKQSNQLLELASRFEWPGHNARDISAQKSPLNDEQLQQFALGRKHYLTTCAGCHGADGAGMKRFAPPLVGSDWVTGDEKRLALIVLHGMEGPVEVGGKTYDTPEILPVMPAHTTMDDAAITAILTYIRNEWGNNAGPMGKRTVGTTRNTSQGRVVPWKAEELKKYMQESKVPESK